MLVSFFFSLGITSHLYGYKYFSRLDTLAQVLIKREGNGRYPSLHTA